MKGVNKSNIVLLKLSLSDTWKIILFFDINIEHNCLPDWRTAFPNVNKAFCLTSNLVFLFNTSLKTVDNPFVLLNNSEPSSKRNEAVIFMNRNV